MKASRLGVLGIGTQDSYDYINIKYIERYQLTSTAY